MVWRIVANGKKIQLLESFLEGFWAKKMMINSVPFQLYSNDTLASNYYLKFLPKPKSSFSCIARGIKSVTHSACFASVLRVEKDWPFLTFLDGTTRTKLFSSSSFPQVMQTITLFQKIFQMKRVHNIRSHLFLKLRGEERNKKFWARFCYYMRRWIVKRKPKVEDIPLYCYVGKCNGYNGCITLQSTIKESAHISLLVFPL